MTTYAVTGATGPFGRHVIEALLERGAAPSDIVAVARTPEKAADLAERGVQVREGHYDRPETLGSAFDGVQRLLLVSGSEVGRRVAQHTAVIDAARAAGVQRIVYTSALRADTTDLPIAPEHKATEAALRASGVPYTILRNSWYTENYTSMLDTYRERGAIVDATGDGRISAAPRAEYADAAAAVLLTDGNENAIYELGGTAFTMEELAATVSDVIGTPISHQSISPAELAEQLHTAGLDENTAGFVAALDEATARGDLYTDSDDLARLIGRQPTPLADAIRAA
jgi:NAD(P)H dehydrogenase (quinone)